MKGMDRLKVKTNFKKKVMAAVAVVAVVLAAVLLAAQEVYGFGHKRAWRLLKRADEIICTTLDSEEIIREVWERMGLEINFREGVERIREVEEAQ